ncbi:CoA transferase [Arenicella chitinivorans]|uniref:CoA transferase n=1 Tax=Arenicella chitinivorans TaxID=1329800 RepID=A0A918RI58_9GAMM|nr:CaiB/BaiF CoA-transferase family protein [Arenicella chitinivorans]GGZ97877.1 CoA transferase [Arenicella chitinivorans]
MIKHGALSHLKVLDLSRVLAGPWAGQVLADFGADVIKVEQPEKGDDTRHWAPPYMPDSSGADTAESAYYLCANRGKRSICVDIRSAEGQAVLHALVQDSDVVIENFKAGHLANYHLDYDTLSNINPALIYCSITGFGQTGPYSERPGYDFLIQAMSGLMSVTGEPDGPPQKVGVAVTDVLTGLYAVIGVLAALSERSISGLGQHIDLSLFDVAVASMANQASNYLVGGMTPQAMGNAHPNIVPYQSFETQQGHCVVAVGNDSQFARFCVVVGRPEWCDDERFKSNSQRVKNRKVLVVLIAEEMRRDTRDNWLAKFQKADVPAAPINNLQDVFNDPQILARQMKINVPHPSNPDLELVGNPLKFSRTPVSYHRPPPELGEHTEEIFNKLKGT